VESGLPPSRVTPLRRIPSAENCTAVKRGGYPLLALLRALGEPILLPSAIAARGPSNGFRPPPTRRLLYMSVYGKALTGEGWRRGGPPSRRWLNGQIPRSGRGGG